MLGGMTRDGVKDLVRSRGAEPVGDSTNPEWVMLSFASSRRRREGPLLGVPYCVCATLADWLESALAVVVAAAAAEPEAAEGPVVGKSAALFRTGEGGRYWFERERWWAGLCDRVP